MQRSYSVSRRGFLQGSFAAVAAAATVEWPRRGALAQSAKAKGELIIRSEAPLNAEPQLQMLAASSTTPVEQFYIRSHGPAPQVNGREYRLQVSGLVARPLDLSLAELQSRFSSQSVEATLTCAGNRRQEMSAIKSVAGVQWDAGAIGHARWTGATLADVLKAAEIKDGARHVWFEGLDPITEKDGSVAPFGGSIPLDKALDAKISVLLADRMNDRPLTAEHGSPLRTVVPGFIGARSVKWLSKIVVSDRPSPNHYVAEAYKIVRSDSKDELAAAQPIYSYPINAAICAPTTGEQLKAGKAKVSGYALATGEPDCTLDKVELSRDGGRTWMTANIQNGAPAFAWNLWFAEIELSPGRHELVVRAADTKGHRMPERCEWNIKGYLYNAWHRVPVEVA